MKKTIILYFISFLVLGCTDVIKINNEKEGNLIASVNLVLNTEKKFKIDNQTAPKVPYIQIFENKARKRYFTFLNTHNNSIYIYDYDSSNFVKKIQFARRGAKGISQISAYYIVSLDSIYLFNEYSNKLILMGKKERIISRVLLREPDQWNASYYYPPFMPRTVRPILKYNNNLILCGSLTGEIPDTIYEKIRHTCSINIKNKRIEFFNSYPNNLYKGYTWGDLLFRAIFYDLNTSKDIIIYSYPISHDVYITSLKNGNTQTVYAGSNFAGAITSLNKKPKFVTNELTVQHFLGQDVYGAIKYDKFRNVYYRLIRYKIDNPEIGKYSMFDKENGIIIYDKNFKYLGETKLGKLKNYFWLNMFVTKEGLNIQYTDGMEEAIHFKIYNIKEI